MASVKRFVKPSDDYRSAHLPFPVLVAFVSHGIQKLVLIMSMLKVTLI